jgi:FkbM family methyltransferase
MTFPVTALHSLPAGSLLQLLGDPHMRVSFSQFGEDIVIFHMLTYHFPPIKNGFYVDIGAYHPRQYSSTQFLRMMGWSGINIDASKESIEAFQRERPNDINIQVGVGAKEEVLTFHKFAQGACGVNTLSAEFAKKWQESSGSPVVQTETVRVRPVNDVLAEALPIGRTIDYLNIDVEGMDRVVALSLDLSRFRPKILTLELHDSNILALEKEEVVAHLVGNGYKLVAVAMVTHVFIDSRAAINF